MARIDRARLDAFGGGVVFEVPTRFDDLDMQGDVNNAAAVVLLQEARAAFNKSADLSRIRGVLRVLVAGLTVEYAGEMHYPGVVTVRTGLLAIGRTSLTLAQIARQSGDARLYAEAVLVLADAKGPAAIPDDLREAYAVHLIPEISRAA